MRKLILTAAAVALSSLLVAKADAMSLGAGAGVRSAAESLGIVEKSQFFYGGRNYCWYPDGWHGPGFYWCGYAFRPGFGWGGPVGWRGWHHGGPRFRGPHVGGPRMMGPRVGGPGMGGARIMGPRVGGPSRVGAPGGGGGRPAGGRVGGPKH